MGHCQAKTGQFIKKWAIFKIEWRFFNQKWIIFHQKMIYFKHKWIIFNQKLVIFNKKWTIYNKAFAIENGSFAIKNGSIKVSDDFIIFELVPSIKSFRFHNIYGSSKFSFLFSFTNFFFRKLLFFRLSFANEFRIFSLNFNFCLPCFDADK